MQKKILYVHHGYILGGAPVSLKYTISSVLRKLPEFDVTVYCAYKSMMPFFSEIPNIKVKKFPYPCQKIGRVLIGWASLLRGKTFLFFFAELLFLPVSIFNQYRVFKKEAPDIIHLNSSILMATAIAAKIAEIPIVWHVREVLLGNKLKKRFAGYIIRKFANQVICISEIEAKSLGKNSPNVNIVYNFIDFNKFSYNGIDILKEKNKYQINKNEKVILSLGGVAPRKGTVQLIEAMSFLDDDYKLVIAGPTYKNEKNRTKKIYINLKLAFENFLIKIKLKKTYMTEYSYRVSKLFGKYKKGNIIFIGMLENIVPILSISDALIFAGTTPHFPRPVFEAWAMKKPVIVFDMEGINNQITNMKDGIIVKGVSGKKLADAIKLLFADKHRMKLMGETGYPNSINKFNSDINTDKIISVYNKI